MATGPRCPVAAHPEGPLFTERTRSIPEVRALARQWPFFALSFLLAACINAPNETPVGGLLPDPDGPDVGDNKAFGNVQPHHVYDPQHHDAIRAYGPSAVLVCNAALPVRGLLDDLRAITGPDVVLLANDNSIFVPLWGEQSEMWNAYRAAMDPARFGLPDSAWYWIDEHGARTLAPMACHGGWCGEYWPGWALKPDTLAYRAKAEFIASRISRMDEFDGVWLDDWHEGFSAYQVEGLGLPPERQHGLSQRWIVCRRYYVDRLRELLPADFLLVPNLQPARFTDYPAHEMVRFDAHTCEFPDDEDLVRFETYPSSTNVGWTGHRLERSGVLDVPGVVRFGYGLPANVDP